MTVFRRTAVTSSVNDGRWLDVRDHVRTGEARLLDGTEARPATNGERSAAQQLTSSGHLPTQDGGPPIRQTCSGARCTLRLPSKYQYKPER